jgi:hypothetical protein
MLSLPQQASSPLKLQTSFKALSPGSLADGHAQEMDEYTGNIMPGSPAGNVNANAGGSSLQMQITPGSSFGTPASPGQRGSTLLQGQEQLSPGMGQGQGGARSPGQGQGGMGQGQGGMGQGQGGARSPGQGQGGMVQGGGQRSMSPGEPYTCWLSVF